MKIQIDLPKEEHKKLEIHKLRYNLHDKREALVDIVKRFFTNEDYSYFDKVNEEKRTNNEPAYIKAINREEKVRKSPKKKS